MATSGDSTWELDRNGLIEAAYRKLGIPGEGNTLTTEQYNDGLDAINGVIALAVTDGMALWKRTNSTQTPSATSQVYTITGAVKVAQVTLRTAASNTQWDLENKSLYDFQRLPYNTTGVPVSWTWQPTIAGGTVSIWPHLADSDSVSNKQIIITYQKKFDGFDATTTETLDFPSYWSLPIIYQTAVILAPENGIPVEDRKALQGEATRYWASASSYGDEDGSIFIMPFHNSWK